MKLALVQTNLVWEDIKTNLEELERKIEKPAKTVDLVILPEMFTTAFSMQVELAKEAGQKAGMFLKEQSKKHNTAICGSTMFKENDNCFNRLLCYDRGELIHSYNKRHLFSMAGEHKHYQEGVEFKPFSLKGVNIATQICYDLRFPVFCRNNTHEPYDLLVYVANWPAKRVEAWRKLLQARAIENQCYVAAVNRVGIDGNGFEYNGYSTCIDPMGQTIWECANKEDIGLVSLDKAYLDETRQKLPFLANADKFRLA